ncbi:hypothetical protein HQ496_06285 [bacterium]|nr:hypothetical protein [bacterium]
MPLLLLFLFFFQPIQDSVETDHRGPVDSILKAIEENRVVALGENHGHAELHDLILKTLATQRASEALDDIVVEWGNSLYQPTIDRYLAGDSVPWDSVALAWRNAVVSPNTVWDSEVYANFFKGVREINSRAGRDKKFRVLLADSPINWDVVESRNDVVPFFDRAASMAEILRTESLLKGRKSLFLAGGLHVSKKPRTHINRLGIPYSEITPIAWVEFKNPGVTFVIQSFGKAAALNLTDLTTDGAPKYFELKTASALRSISASSTSSLKNMDGTRPDVYPDLVLGDLVDAVILWDQEMVTFLEPKPEVYEDDVYWTELNRRSQLMRGGPMDTALRER